VVQAWLCVAGGERARAAQGVRVALAGFDFRPDAEFADRVGCRACGLNVGAWEPGDDPREAHAAEAPGACAALSACAAAYAALDAGRLHVAVRAVGPARAASAASAASAGGGGASRAASGAGEAGSGEALPPPTRGQAAAERAAALQAAPARAGGATAGAAGAGEEGEFAAALDEVERLAQRLVVERSYGQRLETLTSALVSKIQTWVVRLAREEDSRSAVRARLARAQSAPQPRAPPAQR
jgi:hypothetical protein